MKYVDNWERIEKRFKEYWNMENHDRPLIAIRAPKDNYRRRNIQAPANLYDRWTDMDYLIETNREHFASTYYGGEAFPSFNPNLGPDIVGAVLGCDLEFGESTSWAGHIVDNWENAGPFRFDPENKWWKKIVEMTKAAIADSRGDYAVGVTDLHAGLDAVVSLRGPEKTAMDLYDNPEAVKKAAFEIFDVFVKMNDSLYDLTSKNIPGSTNWAGIWHPGKWYVTSCDFICMISREMFREFILPELQMELDYLDASIFHLDGPGALKHLDDLLSLPKLGGIQWVYGAGQPSASHWIPVLKKIQDAGKMIQVNIEPEELPILLKELKPEGVLYMTSCSNEQDARDLLALAEKRP